jgi:tripartite-type tricarboxylate transporter receptor subunit TctC
VRRALAQPDVKQRFADLGMTIESSTPESTDAYIKSETAKWAKLIKDADIRAPD